MAMQDERIEVIAQCSVLTKTFNIKFGFNRDRPRVLICWTDDPVVQNAVRRHVSVPDKWVIEFATPYL